MRATSHDGVIKLKLFSALLAICVGNSPATGEFPSQRANNAGFDVSVTSVRISRYINIWMAGDLRIHAVHVTSP